MISNRLNLHEWKKERTIQRHGKEWETKHLSTFRVSQITWQQFFFSWQKKLNSLVKNVKISWEENLENRNKKYSVGSLCSKLKASCQEERLLKWNEHFLNMIVNSLEISNGQLDIKLRRWQRKNLKL